MTVRFRSGNRRDNRRRGPGAEERLNGKVRRGSGRAGSLGRSFRAVMPASQRFRESEPALRRRNYNPAVVDEVVRVRLW